MSWGKHWLQSRQAPKQLPPKFTDALYRLHAQPAQGNTATTNTNGNAQVQWSAAEFPNRLAILILLTNIPIFLQQKFDFFSSAKGVPFLPWKISLKRSPPSPFGVVPSLNMLPPSFDFMLLYGKPDLSGAFTVNYVL